MNGEELHIKEALEDGEAILDDKGNVIWLNVTEVQLKHNPYLGTAKIESVMSDVKGGVVLDRFLDGFRCWNIKDLLIAKK